MKHPWTTHGMTGTPTHRAWKAMLTRARNPNIESAAFYTGRGITVCKRWLVFETFLADMGERPSPEHSLDRYPNKDGNYEPANCRWATLAEQANNTRANIVIKHQGESRTVAQWSRHLNIPADRIYKRIQRGWNAQRALTEP